MTLSRTNSLALDKLHDLSELSVVLLTSKGCERLRGPYMKSAFTAVPGISTQLMSGPSVTHTKSLQSCPALCDPMDRRPQASSVHGILQARILEWVAISCSGGSSLSRDRTHISYISCTSRYVLYCKHHPGNQHHSSWDLGIRSS